jgi:hypothetical protein
MSYFELLHDTGLRLYVGELVHQMLWKMEQKDKDEMYEMEKDLSRSQDKPRSLQALALDVLMKKHRSRPYNIRDVVAWAFNVYITSLSLCVDLRPLLCKR